MCIYIYIYIFIYLYVVSTPTCSDALESLKGVTEDDIGALKHVGVLTIYKYIIYIYIQGVTGGTDQTSGGCSLC